MVISDNLPCTYLNLAIHMIIVLSNKHKITLFLLLRFPRRRLISCPLEIEPSKYCNPPLTIYVCMLAIIAVIYM